MSTAHTILVVDDNAPALKATTRILQQAGYTVAEAGDGVTALEQTKSLRPSLVLLDVVLPDLPGAEVLRQIRADPALQAVTVVLLSALLTKPEEQAGGLDAGADGYIARPVANAELLARVRTYLRQRELTDKLRESEERFHALVDWTPEAIAVHRDGKLLFVNPTAVTLLGAETTQELLGKSIEQLTHPDFYQVAQARIKQIAAHGGMMPLLEGRLIKLDGAAIEVEVQGRSIVYEGAPAIISSIRDITLRKAHEVEIARLNRLYSALSQINQAISRMPTRQALFQRACQVLGECGGFRMAWIGWHHQKTHALEPVAVWGDTHGYVGFAQIYTDDRPESRGPSGTSFSECRPYICNDLLNDPATLRWRTAAERSGFRASAAFPIRSMGEVLGVLNVYAVEPGIFQDKEIALLVEVANDISFGLDNFARDDERRAAEKRARSEKLFSDMMFESLPGILYLYNDQGRFLRWNRNFEKASGHSGEEIAAMRPWEFFSAAEAPLVKAKIAEVFEKGEAFIEASFVAKDGRATPHYFTGRRVDFGGEACLIGMGVDVSERSRAEVALRESEGQLRQIFEHSPAVLYALTLEGGKTVPHLVSENIQRLLGFTVAESLSHEWWVAQLHPEDRAAAIARSSETTAHETSRQEYRLRHKDGSYRWLEDNRRLVRNGEGTPTEIVGVWIDITARRQAEEAVKASEMRFKALFEQAAVGVAQADAMTGRFIQVNQRFAEIVGYSREELVELTFSAITFPQDVGGSMTVARRLTAGEIREFTSEKRYVRKDGAVVWANVTVSAMWAPGDLPDKFVAVVQDISQRKKLEEQFRQAQKMEAIGTLAGGIAHDFNNILAAINGYTELSRLALQGNPKVNEYLGSVLQASGRAKDLVRQILTFSRQQPEERHPIELRPIVAETIKLLRATVPSTIEFDASLAADAPTVLADATQVHQLLMNLGTNAWHAMKDHPGRLQFKLERWVVDEAQAAAQSRLRPGLYARVSVSDTGCGMDAPTLLRIFEPFFTTKPMGEGTGLGLAVVHGIMESHEGAVTVYSEPDVGSVFHLYFPAHLGKAVVIDAPAGPPLRGHGQRILFVDDEEMLVRLGQTTLVALGYEVEVATTPVAGLALVRADPQRFALVVTDQTMPGMTGLAFANQLHIVRPGLPIILMTGYGLALAPEQVKANGICQLLLKPTTIQSLAAAVHAALV